MAVGIIDGVRAALRAGILNPVGNAADFAIGQAAFGSRLHELPACCFGMPDNTGNIVCENEPVIKYVLDPGRDNELRPAFKVSHGFLLLFGAQGALEQGAVIAALGERKGVMKDMNRTFIGTIRMSFIIPTRWLFGFRGDLLQITRGTGIMYQNFYRYQKYLGEGASRQVGVLISKTAGKAVAFALDGLQDRGEIFIRPGDQLYEGMIVGVNNKGNDLVVNATKEKQLSNMRASGADEAIKLIEPRELTLEFALEFIADDELFEITPKNIRLRKRYLSENERKSRSRRAG